MPLVIKKTIMKKFFSKKRTGRRGFTLIELLVVIAIIGVLASIVLASLNTARKKSRDTRRVADMNQVKLALELYFDSIKNYPLDVAGGNPAGVTPTYISVWPTPPAGAGETVYEYDGLVADVVPGAGANLCTAVPCAFFHVGATIEDTTIGAKDSRANRCPAAGGNCGSILLDDTIIFGRDTITRCTDVTAGSYGCYDITP